MTSASDAVARLQAFADLRLDDFQGLHAGTTLTDAEQAFGPSDAGVKGRLGFETLWFRVYPLPPRDRLTVWFQDSESDQVLYVERAVDAALRDWLKPLEPQLHRPAGSKLIASLPERGLAILFSARSRLPVLAYAFVPLTRADFDDSHLAFLS